VAESEVPKTIVELEINFVHMKSFINTIYSVSTTEVVPECESKT